ncbi:MAG: pseudouridine synthase [Porticoccus sp.]|nr:pseudouridine synthase [Porticoccus sp.]
MASLLLFNKPYGVLSQFSDHDGHKGLKHYINYPDVYPMGRLDRDSEGLLLLSDDGQLQARIADPKFKMEKTYLVQIEGDITPAALKSLATGIMLNDGMTKPAKAKKILVPSVLPRNPPIRQRAHQPTSWIELQIKEGRNRQVRRMTAAVGFPTLRLIRSAIGVWQLGDIKPCEYRHETIHLPQQQKRTSAHFKTKPPHTKPPRRP